MSLITKTINYNLIGGSYLTEAVQLEGSNIIATLAFSGLSNNTATVELQQSIDGNIWGVVPDSSKNLETAQTSHAWNVIGLVRGAFLRISLKPSTCTGTLLNLKVLSNE